MENETNKMIIHYDNLASISYGDSKYDEYVKYYINMEKIETRNATIDDILS